MKILINERLSKHRCKTPEGYLICTDAILARTGKQTYRKNEIFKDSDDETEIEVDRTEDEVFSPQTLASFENKPVTVEHPDEDVNVHNYKEYAVGFVRDVHRGEVNGQPVILGNLVITDEQTIQEIENGEHTDLSCGYDCDIADEPNPCQRNIRGNHVALCEQGRAGIARIVDSKCKDFDDTTKNIRVVKEFIEQNGNKFDKRKDADAILEYIKKRTGIANADYGDVLYIIKEYTRAEITDSVKDQHSVFTEGFRELDPSEVKEILIKRKNGKSYPELVDEYKDIRSSTLLTLIENFDKGYIKLNDSMKDTRMKVANLTNGYAIVPESRWRKFGLNSEVERFTTNLDEARYIRSSLERNDGISFVIIDVTKRRTTDSMKDAFIPPTKESINKFESLLRTSNIEIERKGLTTFGRVHYQVRANMEFAQFVKTLERIDDEMNKLGIPMTFNAGSDGKTCTAGIDLDKQYVKDSQRAQKIQKIVKIVKSIK